MTKKPIVIANCSGCNWDQGFQMLRQITSGHIDAVYGDYLAEMNLSDNARAYRSGNHPGWEKTAEDGILLSLPAIVKIQKEENRTVKIVVNGGALNPKGLAELIEKEIKSKNYNLKVAYVSGDELIEKASEFLTKGLKHLDSVNEDIKLDPAVSKILNKDPKDIQFVSCNAYLGARGILKGLEKGADIIICGRVSDASPVIALSSWWYNWSQTDYDELAGALVAGHLSECSAYTTGSNFSDFWRYRPFEKLLDLAFPIVEINHDGSFVVTKHESLNGFVNLDTVRCQFLYELQGTDYLNSDVKALLNDVKCEEIGENRVKFFGIKGAPPPETTKLAIFWNSGYQSSVTVCATGTSEQIDLKFDLYELQVNEWLKTHKVIDQFDVLEFQRYAHPDKNSTTQEYNTSFFRIFAQSQTLEPLKVFFKGIQTNGMQHFHGAHFFNGETLKPRDINTFFPSVVKQQELEESVTILGEETYLIDKIQKFEELKPRENYETSHPVDLKKFGPTVESPLCEVVLCRSGDKGSNSNLGVFVHTEEEYEWLKTWFTKNKLKELIADDWQDWFYIERVELPGILAVHFVVYGILGRGVSSSSRIDNLGKGFADYVLSKTVQLPKKFVDKYKGLTYEIK